MPLNEVTNFSTLNFAVLNKCVKDTHPLLRAKFDKYCDISETVRNVV